MKTKLLKKYVIARLKSAESQLFAYNNDTVPERLHLVRVDIKKLKAICSFINQTSKEKISVKKLNPLFHKAGDIRELQINIQLLSTLPQFTDKQIAQLKMEEKILSEQFLKSIPLFIGDLKSFRKRVSVPAQFPSENKIKKYFKKKTATLSRNLRNKDRERMHLFRKRIKEIMYVFNSLPEKYQIATQLNKQYIDSLQKKAGDWHDAYAAICYFSTRDLAGLDENISFLKVKEAKLFNALLTFTNTLNKDIRNYRSEDKQRYE